MTSPDPTTNAAPAPRPRADAARNRERILEVAEQVFADRGISATLNDIAHAAGVGVGTVYRKFPHKTALIEELIDAKVHRVTEFAVEAYAHESAGAGLRWGLMESAAMRAHDRGLFSVLFSPTPSAAANDARVGRMLHLWDDLIARAKDEGAVREDFTGADVDLFLLMVGRVADAARDSAPLAWRRCAEVLLDGYGIGSRTTPLSPVDLDTDARHGLFLHT